MENLSNSTESISLDQDRVREDGPNMRLAFTSLALFAAMMAVYFIFG